MQSSFIFCLVCSMLLCTACSSSPAKAEGCRRLTCPTEHLISDECGTITSLSYADKLPVLDLRGHKSGTSHSNKWIYLLQVSIRK